GQVLRKTVARIAPAHVRTHRTTKSVGIRPEKPELVLWKVVVCREKPARTQQMAVAVAADDPLREPIRGLRRPPRIMGVDLRCGGLERLPETRHVLAQFAHHHIAPVEAKAAEACRRAVGQQLGGMRGRIIRHVWTGCLLMVPIDMAEKNLAQGDAMPSIARK